MDIGKHCALQSCNALDFLPIQCSCLKSFCKLHISPDLHDCPSVQQPPLEPLSPPTRARSKCALSGCNKPPLLTGVNAQVDPAQQNETPRETQGGCPGCQLQFCIDHRHVQSHSCTSLAIVEKGDVKHETARAILAAKFLSTAAPTPRLPVVVRRNPPVTSDPQKLAQLKKVSLMKMRHKAIPGDPRDKGSVPVDQRLHVTVRLEMNSRPAKEAVLWFRKTVSAGKALDLVVQHFSVTHTGFTLHLKQSSAESGDHVLQNHLELSSQIEDGSTIVLTDSQSSE